MLIILWMWTRHTQKGRFSLQCHQEISKNLLENFTYKSFWVFSPVFHPRLAIPSQDRCALQSCYWFTQGSTHAKELWMCILLLDLGQSCTKCKSSTLLCISTAESARGETLHLCLQRGGGTPQKNCLLACVSVKSAYVLRLRFCAWKIKISLQNLKQ